MGSCLRNCVQGLNFTRPIMIMGQPQGTRGFHSSGVKRMSDHGHDEPAYMHAKHMYNLDQMKNQKLQVSLGVLAAFSIGVGVPIWAVNFQQKKTSSG
ncbi:hypothetical protein C1H46_032332 [Malus baccata]|uniref:SLL1 protein n=1 Tax=Malus baccata TaxID=106549 RepID=A0A540L6K0_MALBA|nr:hypothetical protein C1H46_032332 [Malus baccata]